MMSSEDQDAFPNIAKFCRADIPAALQRSAVRRAFEAYSDLTAAETDNVAIWGTMPILRVASRDGERALGWFRTTTPNLVFLDARVADAHRDRPTAAMVQRVLESTILHELVHWGEYRINAKLDPDERGRQFELDAYGRDFGYGDLGLEIGYRPVASDPRGIRNSNPGNIRVSSDTWDGTASEAEREPFQKGEATFVVFRSAAYGIRAMIKILRTYRSSYGATTVRNIITRWAPPSENDTESYIETVCEWTGFDAVTEIDPNRSDDVLPMCKAIIRMENGKMPYTRSDLDEGFDLAAN